MAWWEERWVTRANDEGTDSNLASIFSVGTELGAESICSNIVPEGPPNLFAQPNQRFGLPSRYCEKRCAQTTFAAGIKNNSPKLGAASIIVSLGEDPFFGPLFVDQECIKKFIEFPGGSSAGQDFKASIGKGYKLELREVKKVRVSRGHSIQTTNQLGLSHVGRTIDSLGEKRPILTKVTTRKGPFVADIVRASASCEYVCGHREVRLMDSQ